MVYNLFMRNITNVHCAVYAMCRQRAYVATTIVLHFFYRLFYSQIIYQKPIDVTVCQPVDY